MKKFVMLMCLLVVSSTAFASEYLKNLAKGTEFTVLKTIEFAANAHTNTVSKSIMLEVDSDTGVSYWPGYEYVGKQSCTLRVLENNDIEYDRVVEVGDILTVTEVRSLDGVLSPDIIVRTRKQTPILIRCQTGFRANLKMGLTTSVFLDAFEGVLKLNEPSSKSKKIL